MSTRDGLSAVAFLANAYESYLYKRKFDEAYTAGDLRAVQHLTFFEHGYEPTIAVSALLALDEIQVDDDVARIALNVFPTGTGVSVVLSFLSNETPHVLPFLKPFRSSSGEALLECFGTASIRPGDRPLRNCFQPRCFRKSRFRRIRI